VLGSAWEMLVVRQPHAPSLRVRKSSVLHHARYRIQDAGSWRQDDRRFGAPSLPAEEDRGGCSSRCVDSGCWPVRYAANGSWCANRRGQLTIVQAAQVLQACLPLQTRSSQGLHCPAGRFGVSLERSLYLLWSDCTAACCTSQAPLVTLSNADQFFLAVCQHDYRLF
jgi:hypothetical protein